MLAAALAACGKGEPAREGATTQGTAAAAPADIVVADVGLSTPESVLEPKWIDAAAPDLTLNAPKSETCPAGATFLNDVTAGEPGTIYFTDSGFQAGPEGLTPSGSDAVYRYVVSEGSVVPVSKEPTLGGPNGVAVDGRGVTVVTFGSGEAYRFGLDGTRVAVLPSSQLQLDGVELLADGILLVSSWGDQCVYCVAGDGTMTKVLEGVEAPADLSYDVGRSRVLVPLFNANRVVIHPLG